MCRKVPTLPIVLLSKKLLLGCSVLKFSPNIFLSKARYQALGQVCKFVPRCKKFYRIGPRCLSCTKVVVQITLKLMISFQDYTTNSRLLYSNLAYKFKEVLSFESNLSHEICFEAVLYFCKCHFAPSCSTHTK